MTSGLLVLDNNCYERLEDPAHLATFRANLREADFIPVASEVNLVEIASVASDNIRGRLLHTLREVTGSEHLLSWPFQLLRQIGDAILAGEPRFAAPPSGKEWYLDDPDALKALREDALKFQRTIEEKFSHLHDRARQRLQRRAKSSGTKNDFASTCDFLTREWSVGETRGIFASLTWEALGLPGDAPLDSLYGTEAWKLFLDVEGAALYERAVAIKQPKRVQRMDLIQLVYLAGASRRMIATADRSFLRAANEILKGRYPNARAIHIEELIS